MFERKNLPQRVERASEAAFTNYEQWPKWLREDISETESHGRYRPFQMDLRVLFDAKGNLDPDEVIALQQNAPDYEIDERLRYISSGEFSEQQLAEMGVFADCDLKKTARYQALLKDCGNRAQEKAVVNMFGLPGIDLLATGWRPLPHWVPTSKEKGQAATAMGNIYSYYEERRFMADAMIQHELQRLDDPRIKFQREAITQRHRLERTMQDLYKLQSDDEAALFYDALHTNLYFMILQKTDAAANTQTKLAEVAAQRRTEKVRRYKETTKDVFVATADISKAVADRAIAGTFSARIGADTSRRWLQAQSGVVRGHVADYVSSEVAGIKQVMKEPGRFDEVEKRHKHMPTTERTTPPWRTIAGVAVVTAAGSVAFLGGGSSAAAAEMPTNSIDLTSILSDLTIVPSQPVNADVLSDVSHLDMSIEGATIPAATLPEASPPSATSPETKLPNHEKVAESTIKNILTTIDAHTGKVAVEGKQYNLGDVITLHDGTVIVAAPQYIQFSGSWADNSYYGSTIAHAGCFPTAEATVARTLKHNTSFTPATMASFNTANGVGSGEHEAFYKMAQATGLPIATYDKNDSDKVRAVLKGGGLLIATGMAPDKAPFTSAGHAVVIRGIRPDNTLILADPNYRGDDLYSYKKVTSGMQNFPHFYAFWPKK